LSCIEALDSLPVGQQPVVLPGAKPLIVAGAPEMLPPYPPVSTASDVPNLGATIFGLI
jgi:hypothetical protein